MKKPPIPERVYQALVHSPNLRKQTNAYIAAQVGAKNPLSVSQAISKLHTAGRIRVHHTGELTPIRHINVP